MICLILELYELLPLLLPIMVAILSVVFTRACFGCGQPHNIFYLLLFDAAGTVRTSFLLRIIA